MLKRGEGGTRTGMSGDASFQGRLQDGAKRLALSVILDGEE